MSRISLNTHNILTFRLIFSSTTLLAAFTIVFATCNKCQNFETERRKKTFGKMRWWVFFMRWWIHQMQNQNVKFMWIHQMHNQNVKFMRIMMNFRFWLCIWWVSVPILRILIWWNQKEIFFSATMENGGNGKSADEDQIMLAEHFDERQITWLL